MRLPDNFFRDLSPTDIVSKVASITLAEISRFNTETLLRIGWLNNPVIDILYSMTNAGVWVSRTDASGRLTEANSTNNYTVNNLAMLASVQPNVSAPVGSAAATKALRIVQVVPFTSTAGGGLAADIDLSGSVGAQAGYFMVIDEVFFISLDVGGASTPTFVFSTTTHDAFRTHGALTVTGDNQINKQLESVPIYYEDDDDEVVYLDTTCADLGNTKSWLAIVKFHFET